jgi:opacity protein-like surface antigen
MSTIARRTHIRSFRNAALLLTLSLGARFVAAQALSTATGPGNYISLGGGISSFPSDYDSRKIAGSAFFLDIQPDFRLGFEAEARFLRYRTDESVDQTNYLAGPRITFRRQRFRPYAKFLAGSTRIEAPFGYGHGTFFTFAPGAGVDYLLTPRIILRVVDVEYQIVPQFVGTSVRNLGVSIGLSYRLNDLIRFPDGALRRR